MEKPNYSTDDIYKVMRDCWLSEPGLRPAFHELVDKMAEELQEGEKQVLLNLLELWYRDGNWHVWKLKSDITFQHYLVLSEPLEAENAAKEAKYTALLNAQKVDDNKVVYSSLVHNSRSPTIGEGCGGSGGGIVSQNNESNFVNNCTDGVKKQPFIKHNCRWLSFFGQKTAGK